MPERSAVEKAIKTFQHNELGRSLRQWIYLEEDRLNTSLRNPKYGETETALLRGEHRQLMKLRKLLEEPNDQS